MDCCKQLSAPSRRCLNILIPCCIDRYKNITYSPCVSHCMDLLLEDICKLAWAAPLVKIGREIAKFITSHGAS